MSKRKRSPNWLESEKILLLELVERHLNVVESKKIDGVSLQKKDFKWREIAREYNLRTTHCLRSAANLRCQWSIMKKNAKKQELIRKRNNCTVRREEKSIHSKIMYLIKASTGENSNTIDSDSGASQSSEVLEEQIFLPEGQANTDHVNIKLESEPEGHSNEEVTQESNDYPIPMRDPLPIPIQSEDKTEKAKHRVWKPRKIHPTSSSSLQFLHQKKIEAIEFQNRISERELSNLIESNEIDLQIKREKLKQEKIRTRILLLDLRKKKNELLNQE